MTAFETLRGRRVFLTGHTGFKGAWLTVWLHRLGAQVHGYSFFPPPTDPSVYGLARTGELTAGETAGDLRDRPRLRDSLRACRPDVVLHLAAQPLVLEAYRRPFETFDVNVMGTASLLEAVHELGRPCAVVCVTTDKCYENREQVWGYRESDALGGHDPYSASKGAAEILIAAYRRSFFDPASLGAHGVQVASARAGNVVGGGDWAAGRLVADLARSLAAGRPAQIRNPRAIRPWQHVLEPLSGYLALAVRMLDAPGPNWCSGWNFGPLPGGEATVAQLADLFVRAWGEGRWEDCGLPGQPHEASTLRLCIDKAVAQLGWAPRWSLPTTLRRTADWYRRALRGAADARALCLADIEAYAAAGDPRL